MLAVSGHPAWVTQIRDSARSLASEGKTEEAFDLLVSALDAVLRKSRELELMALKLQRERVGKRSEKVDPGQLQLMFEQLMSQSGGEELEPELDPQTEAREDAELEQQIEEAKKTRPRGKGNKPRRETIRTDGIERQVHLREIPEEERGCSRCGKLKKPLGKDVRRRLEYVPGHFIEHEYHLEKYACGKCREGVTRAEGPAPVIERSSADASLLAHVVVSKYGNGVINGSNPVGEFALTQNEEPFLEFDFSSNPISYFGFQDIDQAGTTGIVTFVGGGTANISFETTTVSGNSAEFFGIFNNDMPLITRVQLDASGDGLWGVDNLEYGVPEPATLLLLGLGLAGLAARKRHHVER